MSVAVRCGFPGGYNLCQSGIAENVNNVPFQCASGYAFNAVDYAYWGQASQIVGSCQANGFSYSTTAPCGTAPIGTFSPNGMTTVSNACIGQSSCSVSSTQAFWGGAFIDVRFCVTVCTQSSELIRTHSFRSSYRCRRIVAVDSIDRINAVRGTCRGCVP